MFYDFIPNQESVVNPAVFRYMTFSERMVIFNALRQYLRDLPAARTPSEETDRLSLLASSLMKAARPSFTSTFAEEEVSK